MSSNHVLESLCGRYDSVITRNSTAKTRFGAFGQPRSRGRRPRWGRSDVEWLVVLRGFWMSSVPHPTLRLWGGAPAYGVGHPDQGHPAQARPACGLMEKHAPYKDEYAGSIPAGPMTVPVAQWKGSGVLTRRLEVRILPGTMAAGSMEERHGPSVVVPGSNPGQPNGVGP